MIWYDMIWYDMIWYDMIWYIYDIIYIYICMIYIYVCMIYIYIWYIYIYDIYIWYIYIYDIYIYIWYIYIYIYDIYIYYICDNIYIYTFDNTYIYIICKYVELTYSNPLKQIEQSHSMLLLSFLGLYNIINEVLFSVESQEPTADPSVNDSERWPWEVCAWKFGPFRSLLWLGGQPFVVFVFGGFWSQSIFSDVPLGDTPTWIFGYCSSPLRWDFWLPSDVPLSDSSEQARMFPLLVILVYLTLW